MSEYLVNDIPMINDNIPMGLQPIEIGLTRDNSIYLFTDETKETEGEKGYQAFVEKYLSKVLGFDICLIKEAAAGHTGSVDFLGIDEEGRIFLIEVKKNYHDERRSKFDVIFQSIKYFLDPRSLKEVLFEEVKDISTGKVKDTFNEKVKNKFVETFPETKSNIIDIEEKVLTNLSKHRINVLIVIDQATPQLISTAYTILLRHTQSECRVIEMTLIKISGKVYLYYRKYFSNYSWVDANNADNRKPELQKEDRLDQIKNEEIRKIFKEVVEAFDNSNFYFSWNTENNSYFSTYTMGPKRKYITLGIAFYTQQGRHAPTNQGNILVGSVGFDADFELKGFINQHNLPVEEKHWPSPSRSGVNYYSFILNPENVRQLGSHGIMKLINDYRNVFLEHRR